MARHYCAFLVRCWALEGSARRFEVTHIQSGERRLVAALGEALAWMEAAIPCDDAAEEQSASLDQLAPRRARH